MCAVMIESMPALIAALNGGASIVFHSCKVWLIVGSEVWLSSRVSPWPGKCFAVAMMPASFWYPWTWATVMSLTSFGSLEKERTPMTGLSAFTLTSATGA